MKTGGPRRAYIETVPVEVANGEFRITFTALVESPAIKAIEIIPQSEAGGGGASSAKAIRIKAGQSEPFTDSSGQLWQPDEGFEGGAFGAMNPLPGGFGGRLPGGQGPPMNEPNQRPNTQRPDQRSSTGPQP